MRFGLFLSKKVGGGDISNVVPIKLKSGGAIAIAIAIAI